jgi:hypothetical protein
LLGTQEQVDAESDLVDRAVISVDVAADKESDMPQGAGPLGGGDQVEFVFRRGSRAEVADRDLRRVPDFGNQGRDRNIDEGQVWVGKVEVENPADSPALVQDVPVVPVAVHELHAGPPAGG